MNEYDMMM